MKNTIRLILVILIFFGTAYAGKEPKKAKLLGEDSSSLKMMIRTVDDGEILWVGSYKLGTKTEVVPGFHKINVMCEFSFSWGTKLLPGDITHDFESGKTYDLSGTASTDGERCEVQVNVRT